MTNNALHILLFHHSETLLKGLYATITEIGIEPIIIKTIDTFFDYPQLSGNILVILPEELLEEHRAFIDAQYKSTNKIKYLLFSSQNKSDEHLYIDDSSVSIQNKIQQIVTSFSENSFPKQTPDLTPREIEVLKQVALGYTNKEIANNLFISTHTAISHRKNISEKLGIKTISGLTMYAVIKQIIEIKDITTENLK